jgi:hypothetical protein
LFSVCAIDITIAGITRGIDDPERIFLGLDPVNGFLHRRIKILHPEAKAIEALLPQCDDTFRRNCARIDLYRVFALPVWRELKTRMQMFQQICHLQIRQESRRTAAEMQLFDLVHTLKQDRLHRNFAFQVRQVKRRLAEILADYFIAGAVVANRVAKRDVHIQRQGMARTHVAPVGNRP